MAEAIGSQLTCVFVDHGLMRKNEGDEVEAAFNKWDIQFIRVNAEERFLSKLSGVSDPETKRKIIGEEFIRVFESEAKKIGTVDYLVQGTIYPDVIESGLGKSAVIKSHHNVGGLPSVVDFKEIIEPLRDLFKDEVRRVGFELGLPRKVVMRQPFPGPGLAIRIMGEVTREKLETLREADFILRDEIAKAGLDEQIWQYFAVITNSPTVGVMGDFRTYGERDSAARRNEHRRDDCGLGEDSLRYFGKNKHPNRQRSQARKPHRLRHHLQTSRNHRMGMIGRKRGVEESFKANGNEKAHSSAAANIARKNAGGESAKGN